MMSLSLSWTCQRDRISLIVKFELNKYNFFYKKNDNNNDFILKYYVDVETCESFRGFSFIYVYRFS